MTTRPKMLSATFVRTVNVPGRYGDGRGGLGLSLLVKPASRGGFSKSWSQAVRLVLCHKYATFQRAAPCPRRFCAL